MTSQKIQNNIITFLARFIKENINEDLSEYFTKIVDKVTNQFSKKEVSLLCLRYVTFQNGLPI